MTGSYINTGQVNWPLTLLFSTALEGARFPGLLCKLSRVSLLQWMVYFKVCWAITEARFLDILNVSSFKFLNSDPNLYDLVEQKFRYI